MVSNAFSLFYQGANTFLYSIIAILTDLLFQTVVCIGWCHGVENQKRPEVSHYPFLFIKNLSQTLIIYSLPVSVLFSLGVFVVGNHELHMADKKPSISLKRIFTKTLNNPISRLVCLYYCVCACVRVCVNTWITYLSHYLYLCLFNI